LAGTQCNPKQLKRRGFIALLGSAGGMAVRGARAAASNATGDWLA
jgi:hypothetical protein